MKHPHESRVQTILAAQEARRRKPCCRDGVTARHARALNCRPYGIVMLKAELGQPNTHECDDPAAALSACLVLRQQVLQFEDSIGIAAARAKFADRQERERSDHGARFDIDAYARQETQADDRSVGEPRPAAQSLVAPAPDRNVLAQASALLVDPRPQSRDCFMRGQKEVGLARECPQGVAQGSAGRTQDFEVLNGGRFNENRFAIVIRQLRGVPDRRSDNVETFGIRRRTVFIGRGVFARVD
jgi:hypothetical protein